MATVRQKHRGRGLGFWLVLALILHAEAALVVGLGLYFYAPRAGDLMNRPGMGGGETIEIATIDDETAQKLLAELDKAEEKAKEEQTKKELEAVQAPGQVVDLAKPTEEKRPDQAKFAAEYDSSVQKETRKFGRFDQKANQGASSGEDPVNRPAAQATPAGAKAPPGAMAMRTPGQPSKSPAQPTPPVPAAAATPGETGPPAPMDPEGVLSPGGRNARTAQAAQPPSPALGGPQVQPGATSALAPSQQQIARAIGSGTQDHLKDLDDGDETALNAKKWKFASFFNRVKSQVREHWRPVDVYRRRDPTGSIYGNKDRYTLLRVQLKPDGSLANLTLQTPSGVEFLDDEAMEAFKQAQPFPNPPPQLVDGGSGMIDFSFGFYLEISGAPRFKIFKYGQM
jgi:TonB family protein